MLKADQPHVHEVRKRVRQLVRQKAHGVEVAPFHVLKEHVRVAKMSLATPGPGTF